MSLATWQIGFSVLAGLVLFLYGIEHFSKEIQEISGERFRGWLGRFTRNPLRGALLGALTTTVVQSSSATTVIAVSLVHAGTISFAASLGVIFGANVGTTVTAQLVAFELTAFAPIFLVLGFAVSLFGFRFRVLGRPLFYFGLVFFALALVSQTLEPIKNDPRLVDALSRASSVPLALLVGLVITVIVQSSSVTTGLVVLLASADLLTLEQSIPILLGANIGTSSTAILAAARLDLHARRAAMAHTLFNLFGAILFLPLLGPLAGLVSGMQGSVSQQVANAHLIFNLVCALLFLVLVRPFAWLVKRLVPGDESEILLETRVLPPTLPDDTEQAFGLVQDEIRHLLEVTRLLFREAATSLAHPSRSQSQRVERLESLNDFLDERIEGALLDLSRREIGEDQARRVVQLVRISNVLERLGDTGATLSAIGSTVSPRDLPPTSGVHADLQEVAATLDRSFALIETAFPDITPEQSAAHRAGQSGLRHLINRKYALHLERLAGGSSYAPALVVDSLSLMESASNELREIRKQLENPAQIIE